MAVYTVTHKQRADGYACLELLTNSELSVGATITVAGVDATFNGTQVILALPAFKFVGVSTQGDLVLDDRERRLYQIVYKNAGDSVSRQIATGTVTYAPTVTWIDEDDVKAWLGLTGTHPADPFIEDAADAANAFCYRRRREAGYIDATTTAPSNDVKLGTVMYAGALYRSRGSLGDAFAQFDGMGSAPIVAMPGMVRQLLGIDRPQVA